MLPARPSRRSTLRAYPDRVVATLNGEGDAGVKVLKIPEQDAKANGLAFDHHPSAKGHEAIATRVVEALRRDLHWQKAGP